MLAGDLDLAWANYGRTRTSRRASSCACGGGLYGGSFADHHAGAVRSPSTKPDRRRFSRQPDGTPTTAAPSITFAPTSHTSMRRRKTRCPTAGFKKLVRLLGQHAACSWQVTANGPFDGIDVGDYSKPAFSRFALSSYGDGTLRLRGPSIDKLRMRAVVHVFCLPQDDLDLVVGNPDGELNYFENTGTSTAPAFVQRTGSANPFDGIDVGHATAAFARPSSADDELDSAPPLAAAEDLSHMSISQLNNVGKLTYIDKTHRVRPRGQESSAGPPTTRPDLERAGHGRAGASAGRRTPGRAASPCLRSAPRGLSRAPVYPTTLLVQPAGGKQPPREPPAIGIGGGRVPLLVTSV